MYLDVPCSVYFSLNVFTGADLTNGSRESAKKCLYGGGWFVLLSCQFILFYRDENNIYLNRNNTIKITDFLNELVK